MGKNLIPISVLILAILVTWPTCASAGAETAILSQLKRSGFKCTNTPDRQGSFCVNTSKTYVIVPKGLAQHRRNIFYAHGLTGVCGPGASGENYLKDQASFLRSRGAVAVMPFRRNAKAMNFPLGSFLSRMSGLLGRSRWSLVGHSAGGQLLATSLANSGSSGQVDSVLLLDAVYNVDTVKPLWKAILSANPSLKLKIVSSTTAGNARQLASSLEKHTKVNLNTVGGSHCSMSKHFRDL